jgi:Tfp pilus assembly protein FimT
MGALQKRATVSLQKSQRGFSLVQLLVVVAVAVILSAAGVMTIQGARRTLRLSNSARQFGAYLEKTRADSVRRRAQPGNESSVRIVDSKTYRVTLAWGGGTTISARDFRLDSDVEFSTNLTTITFNWRGRPTNGTEIALAMTNNVDQPINIDITGSGDVTVGSEVYQDDDIPAINVNANMSGTGDVAQDQPNPNGTPTPTPYPTATPTPTPISPGDEEPVPTPTPIADESPTPVGTPIPTPTPTPNPTPSPSPTPSPTPAVCAPLLTPPAVTIRKGGGTATISLILAAGGSGLVQHTEPTSLNVTPNQRTLSVGEAGIFVVRSPGNTRGDFTVTFTTPCGSTGLLVSVVN